MAKTTQHVYCDDSLNNYPFYSPRFWSGMRFGDYIHLLAGNRFRIHPQKIPMAFLVGGCTVVNSALAMAQRLFYTGKIEDAQLQPPIFVVGHWRSGTTLLHELLALDSQFCYPTTFQCFVPNHFLVTQPLLEPLVRILLPAKRPMDNMQTGPRHPQEDEFAVVSMGAPSPYYQIAFCNEPPRGLELLTLENCSDEQRSALRVALTTFYKSISLREKKRLILKSPPHTGRIAHLAEWFPGAKFIHITRHPYRIFPSTMHLWRSLAQVQGYQLPKSDTPQQAQYVHRCYEEMYGGYFSQSPSIAEQDLVEVRFEDLLQNPLAAMQRVYESLRLSGFEDVRQKIQSYSAMRSDYRQNKTSLNEKHKKDIDLRWAQYMHRYGYTDPSESRMVAGHLSG